MTQPTLKPGGVVTIEVTSMDGPAVKFLVRRRRRVVLDYFCSSGPDTVPRFLRVNGIDPVSIVFLARWFAVVWLVEILFRRYAPDTCVCGQRRAACVAGLMDAAVPINLSDVVMVFGWNLPAIADR